MNMRIVILSTVMVMSLAKALAQTTTAQPEVDDAYGRVQSEIQSSDSELNSMARKVNKNFSKIQESALKEIAKYRISYTLDFAENIIDMGFFEGGVYYQYVVEPAFRNKEQLRKDIWVIRLGTKGHLAAGGEIRLTFSRFFAGDNAKTDAIKALPYFPVSIPGTKIVRKVPFNTDEVKEKLKVGEGFRFEVLGNIALGIDKKDAKAVKDLKGGVYLNYRRAGQFLMDLYRIDQKMVRTRFIGLKNRGEINAGLDLKNPDLFSFAHGKLKDLLSIGISGAARLSYSPFDDLALDSLMVDYLFNFESAQTIPASDRNAEAALDQIFKNIRGGRFASLFFLFTPVETLPDDLLKHARLAEEMSAQDTEDYKNRRIPFSQVRVFTFFKGRMLSNIASLELGAKVSELVRGKSLSGGMSSHVTSYEDKDPQFFLLNNLFTRHNGRSLFGRNEYDLKHDVDILVTSDRQGTVGRVSDIVINTDIEDTKIPADDMSQYNKIIRSSLPEQHRDNAAVMDILEEKSRTNAFLRYRYVFGEKAFQSIARFSRPELTMKLISFFENHPERRYMHLPSDQPEASIGLGEYAERKAYQIAAIVDPKATSKQSMESFRIAKKDPIFERYLIGEFFSSLMPANADELFSFELQMSSFEAGTKSTTIGLNKSSRVYDAVSFLRAVINDHSLDLQMTRGTDGVGGEVVAPHYINPAKLQTSKQ